MEKRPFGTFGKKKLFSFPRKKKIAKEELKKQVCKNCETGFKGSFCPECGQSAREFDRPLLYVINDFFGNFFSFDSRFFRSFAHLLFIPGRLTIRFFQGKRVLYAPPFRIFIFISFILFLFLQAVTNKVVKNEQIPAAIDSIKMQLDTINVKEAPTDSILIENLQDLDSFKFSGLKNLAAQILKNKDAETDTLHTNSSITFKEYKKKASEVLDSPELFISKFLKYLSWVFFLLLPVFAMILKLLYIRRHKHYIRHLVFSTHYHSFLFLLFSIVIALYLIFGMQTKFQFIELTFWLVPVYLYLAMKHFYGQGVIKTFLKFMILNFIYSIVVTIAVITILVLTAGFEIFT